MPLRHLAAPTLIAVALAGCAGGPPEPRPWHETAAREFNLALAGTEVLGRRVAITRSAQAGGGALPVVVYLPGLGQDSEAGQRWATAWAQAGYAVLTVQPLEADAAAWRSELSRTGEFRALGELHYGAAMQASRATALRRLLAELRTKPVLAGVALDWQRAAVAGYETGAQAAVALGADADPGATAWQPRAVIAISPPPMDSPAATPPLLLVTSDVDGDALGLVTRPADRLRAFDTQRQGAAWLLKLPATSHAALAGTLAPSGWHAQDQHHGRDAPVAQRGAGQGGHAPRGPAGGAPRGPRSGSATEAAQADLRDAMQLSVAFLDAQLRGAALPADPLLLAR